MPRKKLGNHSKPCVPLEGKCTRSRDGLKKPIGLIKACEKCKEWRCKQHCACGRKGAAVGWHAPRDAKKKVLKTNLKQKHPKVAVVAKPVAVAPAELSVVGRPRSLGLGVFSDNNWRKEAFSEIKVASGVMVASLVVDDPDICNLLLSRLKSREKFACEVYVDEDTYTKMRKQYPHRRPRLLELQKHGASVFLCSGRAYCEEFGVKGYRGHFHMKALVIDNKIAYCGSANATRNSRINAELVFRLVGPPVADVVAAILHYKQQGKRAT